MKAKPDKTAAFYRKALDVMFKAVGFRGFDPDFATQQDWYCQKEWTEEQREEFRKWFVVNARKDLGWGKRLSEREFPLFDLMWGWKMERAKAAKCR